MAPRLWHYADNTFQNATVNNFKKMLSLTDDHFAKLTQRALTDPEIDAIKIAYDPFNTGYNNIYANWKGAEGSHEGRTFTTESLFKQLPDLLPVWEGQVYFIFPANTGDARSIFPDKRKPFEAGTYIERIQALKTLYEKLATYIGQPVLLALSATVQSFYNQIAAARLVQQGDEIAISSYSDLLESQRLLCGQEMYGTLGKLMYKYRTNPVQIEEYWDMSLLRSFDNDLLLEESVNIAANTIVNIPITTFVMQGNYLIQITNPATSAVINVGFGPNATSLVSPQSVDAGTFFSGEASTLGFTNVNTFLNIQNETGDADAVVTLKIKRS